MLCAFLVNGIVFGIINTFGILFVKLRERQEVKGDPDAAFKCSLVGSLAIGSTFFISFLAGILVDRVRFFVLIFLSFYFYPLIFHRLDFAPPPCAGRCCPLWGWRLSLIHI